MRPRSDVFRSSILAKLFALLSFGRGALHVSRLLLTLALGAPLLVACGGGGGGGGGDHGDALVGVEVTPAAPSLSAGTSRQLVATAVFESGHREIVTSVVTWSSSDETIATVGNTTGSRGRVTGVAAGSATISANYASTIGSTTVTVTPAVTLDRVEITPADPSLAKGTNRQLTATAVYSDGNTVNVTASAAWSSETPAAVAVGNTVGLKGRIFGAAVGNSVITATFTGMSGTTTATVTAATPVSLAVSPTDPSLADGTTVQLTATATFSDSTTQDVTTSATWTSSAPANASVGDAALDKGKVTANAPGTASVSAEFETLTASTSVTVTEAVAVSLALTPAAPSAPKGTTQAFTATLTFSDATTQNVTESATWASSNVAVATVGNTAASGDTPSDKGIATAKTEGSSSISATASGVTGSTTLTVTAATITSIDVTPKDGTLAPTFERQFAATATLSDGTTRDITADVAWSSNDETIATISNADGSEGLARGEAAGTVTITAQSGDAVGSTDLTISDATLSSIQVTPSDPTIPLGVDQAFTAMGTFSDGSTENITAQVSWASSDPAVATISNADDATRGVASTIAAGTTTISASRAGTAITGDSTLTVTEAALLSIAVTPDTATIADGLTQAFTATGTYSDDTTQDLTAIVTWSSAQTAVATISNADGSRGVATGAGPGTATITATVFGQSDSATLTVTDAVLQGLAVTPSLPKVPNGLQAAFTATGTYSDGSTSDLTGTVTWASSDETKATISNADGSEGVADTLAVGQTTISATSGTVTDSTVLEVTDATLQTITIGPATPKVARGLTLQLAATGNYTDGSTQDLTGLVTWSSSTPATADVSNADGSRGLVNGKELGTVTITALDPVTTKSGTTSLEVTAAVLSSIAVTPASATLPKGLLLGYVATGTFSDATTQVLTQQVTWSSDNTAIATVDNRAVAKGIAFGVAAGTTNVKATLGGVTGVTPITVSDETLSSIAVTPAAATLTLGQTQQYQAVGTFSGGTTLNLTGQVVWASSNLLAATISNSIPTQGLATAGLGALTNTTISATRSGVTGTATLSRGLP